MTILDQGHVGGEGHSKRAAGPFGMPAPDGWTIERMVDLLAGGAFLVSLVLGRTRSPRWRLLASLVSVNLLLDGTAGWCPVSVALHRLGVPTASERATAKRR